MYSPVVDSLTSALRKTKTMTRKRITKIRSYTKSPNVGNDIEARVSTTLELACGIGYRYVVKYHRIRDHHVVINAASRL